jgi:ankyrin repeat protein
VVKFLLKEGNANPNVQNPQTLFTPLHWAAVHGAESIVNILLDMGAKAYTPDKKGFFPIDYAGLFKKESVVRILIKH